MALEDIFQVDAALEAPEIGLVEVHQDSKVPDLQKYTMRDLRELIRDEAPNGRITARSQISPGTITGVHLRDEVFASPTRIIATWQRYDTGATAYGGWWITPTGAYVTLGSSWHVIDPASVMPEVAGYRREFRQLVQWYLDTNVGVTGAQIVIRLAQITGVDLLSAPTANFATDQDIYTIGAWATEGGLETYTGAVYLEARTDWSGAATTGAAIRFYQIQGRYVRL